MTRVIRISDDTYEKLSGFALKLGIPIGEVFDYLFENGQAQIEELRARLDYFNKLEEKVRKYCPEGMWQGWETLESMLTGASEEILSLRDQLARCQEQLHQWQVWSDQVKETLKKYQERVEALERDLKYYKESLSYVSELLVKEQIARQGLEGLILKPGGEVSMKDLMRLVKGW